MDVQDTFYNKDEYVETVGVLLSKLITEFKPNILLQASGNKVSRHTIICGSQNIVLNGKVIVQTGAIIRGDLANVKTGRFCVIGKKAVIRPPLKQFSSGCVLISVPQPKIEF